MNRPTRYGVVTTWKNDCTERIGSHIEERPDGIYVLADDYDHIEAENKRLKRKDCLSLQRLSERALPSQRRKTLKVLIVDIETAGFLYNGGTIIELGIVGLDLETGERTVLLDSVLQEDCLTKEHFTEEPNNWIFENSTLTPEMVQQAPPAEEVFKQAQALFNDDTYRGATAFNKTFDFSFLRDRGLFIEGLPCPMLLSTNLVRVPFANGKCCKWPKVEEAYNFFFPNQEYHEAHRGADDALHEAEIVFELHKRGVFL